MIIGTTYIQTSFIGSEFLCVLFRESVIYEFEKRSSNVVLKGFFPANEVYFGVNKSIFALMRQPFDTNEWSFPVNNNRSNS